MSEIRLNEEMTDIVLEGALTRGIKPEAYVERCIGMLAFLSDQQMKGIDILIRDRQTGEAERLVMETSVLH